MKLRSVKPPLSDRTRSGEARFEEMFGLFVWYSS